MQVRNYAIKAHLQCGFVCGSSNSDFWKYEERDDQFGAVCINTTAKKYAFKNGLKLAISDTTFNRMKANREIHLLRSKTHRTSRLTMLANFACVEESKTAELLSAFVISAHKRVGWEMSHIMSHTVDSASNAVAGNDEMKFVTREERPVEIQLQKCIPHKAATVGDILSGTSKHKVNLNPEAGAILNKVHIQAERINCKKDRRKAVKFVHKKMNRVKYPRFAPETVTRWGSRQEETTNMNCIRHDLDEAMGGMLAKGGCDEEMLLAPNLTSDAVNDIKTENTFSEDEFSFAQQYEGATEQLYQFIVLLSVIQNNFT